MNYKKISKFSFFAFIALALVIPSVSFAINENQADREAQRAERQADREVKKEEIAEQRAEKTCTQLSSLANQIQNRLMERITTLTQKRTEATNKIQTQIQERTANRETKRATIDAKREINWEALEAKAQTDEQKAAIKKFVTAIQNAVKIKRAAIDKIITDFRAGLKKEIGERKSTTDAALNTYRNEVGSIISQVKADCAAGKDAKTIRENFRTEMKKAREAFGNGRKSETKFREEVTPLKEAKKAELKAVIDTFQASIEAAKAELRAAFPKTTETTEIE